MMHVKLGTASLLLLALQPWAQPLDKAGSTVIQKPEVLCGIEKPALEDVQGPRLPGQVLHPTWPPAGCGC